jgi:hypothetical protein
VVVPGLPHRVMPRGHRVGDERVVKRLGRPVDEGLRPGRAGRRRAMGNEDAVTDTMSRGRAEVEEAECPLCSRGSFVSKLERLAGRCLRALPVGRPRKEVEEDEK